MEGATASLATVRGLEGWLGAGVTLTDQFTCLEANTEAPRGNSGAAPISVDADKC